MRRWLPKAIACALLTVAFAKSLIWTHATPVCGSNPLGALGSFRPPGRRSRGFRRCAEHPHISRPEPATGAHAQWLRAESEGRDVRQAPGKPTIPLGEALLGQTP